MNNIFWMGEALLITKKKPSRAPKISQDRADLGAGVATCWETFWVFPES